MPFEILHFRGSDKILEEKNMTKEIELAMEYLNDCLYGSYRKGELLRQALTEMDFRQNGDLNILEGRRYFYKGFRKKVAIDGSFSSYEYIQDALLRLQIGFDKGKIDMGIVLVTAQRSEKSKLGTTRDLIFQEIEMLHPTISLPVTIVLFDLGRPGELYEQGQASIAPVKTDVPAETKKAETKAVEETGNMEASPATDQADTGIDEHYNAEVVAYHEALKNKKKPRAKSKKAALQEQAAA
jgi:hypothetical protein